MLTSGVAERLRESQFLENSSRMKEFSSSMLFLGNPACGGWLLALWGRKPTLMFDMAPSRPEEANRSKLTHLQSLDHPNKRTISLLNCTNMKDCYVDSWTLETANLKVWSWHSIKHNIWFFTNIKNRSVCPTVTTMASFCKRKKLQGQRKTRNIATPQNHVFNLLLIFFN